jgi:hypothetical protein
MIKSVKIFFEELYFIFARPKEFFSIIEKHKKFSPTLLYFSKVWLFLLTLQFLSSGVSQGYTFSLIGRLLVNAVFSWIFILTVIPIYLVSVYLFNGRQGIKKTVQVILYGSVPTLIVSWIPIVPLFVSFYSIYITIVGLKVLQKMSTLRAVLAYLIPYAILIILAVLSVADRIGALA